MNRDNIHTAAALVAISLLGYGMMATYGHGAACLLIGALILAAITYSRWLI